MLLLRSYLDSLFSLFNFAFALPEVRMIGLVRAVLSTFGCEIGVMYLNMNSKLNSLITLRTDCGIC